MQNEMYNLEASKQASKQASEAHQRNYGIDLLRILSMIMIPILHTLGHGGILEGADVFSVRYEAAWLIETVCYCAVDVYALISGYVGYGRKHKYGNILYLLLQVMFYTVITTAVFLVFKRDAVGIKDIIRAAFPFAYRTYWYFTAYFCLFFFMPYLNDIVEKASRKTVEAVLIACFILFSVIPTFFHSDMQHTDGGYSFLWLAIMYLFGAYIKRYDFVVFKKKRYDLLGYGVMVILAWLSKICVELVTSRFLHEVKGGCYLIRYDSPLIILCAVFLLTYFSRVQLKEKAVSFIKRFAPVSFGVYLLHEEPLIRDTIIKGRFAGYLPLNPVLMVVAVLLTGVGIWLVGSLVDVLRLYLFDVLNVRKFCEKTVERIQFAANKTKDYILSRKNN